jgi:hypothetical protein
MFPALAFATVLPARPAAGKWTIYGGGGFTVSPGRTSISNLTLKPSATSGCGKSIISVSGRQKLSTITQGGVTNWVVGKRPGTVTNLISGVGALKVKVHQGGHVMTGGLSLLFAVGGDSRDNDGSLKFGACSLTFSPKK